MTIQHYVISRKNMPDVSFDGKLLAAVSSESSPKARRNGRWTELALYLTRRQKYVLVITGASNHPGEIALNTVHTLDSRDDIIGILGFTRLAKSLYAGLNMRVVEEL